MPTFDHEIEIEAPVDYCFEWGIEPENMMRATPSLIEVENLGETEEGTRFRNTMKILGRTSVAEEIFIVDEAHHTTTSVFEDDELEGEMHVTYTETDDGTHVRLHGEFDAGSGLFQRILTPVMTRYMNRQFRNTLQNMKDLIEMDVTETDAEAIEA